MASGKSIKRKPPSKAVKCPLTCHSLGYLVKKINGVQHRFGRWDRGSAEIDAAVQRYRDQKEYLAAGIEPPTDAGGATVREICTAFMEIEKERLAASPKRKKTYADYQWASRILVRRLGKSRNADTISVTDWEKLHTWFTANYEQYSVVKLVTATKTIFSWAEDAEHITRFRPGKRFISPSKPKRKKVGRKRMFERDEIHAMLAYLSELDSKIGDGKKLRKPPRIVSGAEIQRGNWTAGDVARLRAWILLGVNCGWNAADCGWVTPHYLNLDGPWDGTIDEDIHWEGDGWHDWNPDTWTGWHHYPRAKNGIERHCPLWPETCVALVNCDFGAEYCFETKDGNAMGKHETVGDCFTMLLDALDMRFPMMGYSWFRHTFRTIASGSRDSEAVNYIMGHYHDGMASIYEEGIDPQRLVDVVQHVHGWLFGKQ